ncbi:MAG: mannose-6-phosphate isomerase [Clostridiales bacterium]|nr:mannose-6-phosphate isomerase [Clostridiales bacterium]
MKIDKNLVYGPVFFEPNRARRCYYGGALFADFFGDNSSDGIRPEEWVCSTTEALNDNSFDEHIDNEGVSVVRGTDVLFPDLINAYKSEMLGDRDNLGILVKMLDSAIRLPVQAHPDKAFAREHFHSEYGKTESWLVVATRPNACIFFGFKNKISKAEFYEAVKRSETEKNCMEELLNRVPVKVGDVFLIRAKAVHAIGAGCLVLEVQEPTDFTIQPEHYCGDIKLNNQTMFLGLDPSIALDCFNYDSFGQKAVDEGRQIPIVNFDKDGVKVETLISYDDTPCFALDRVTLTNGTYSGLTASSVNIVLSGDGVVSAPNGDYKVKKGDYFFAPDICAKDIKISGSLELAICKPPKK